MTLNQSTNASTHNIDQPLIPRTQSTSNRVENIVLNVFGENSSSTQQSMLQKLRLYFTRTILILAVLSVMVLVAIVAMPVLFISLIVTRLLQLISSDDDNNNAILLKLHVLTFIYVDLALAIIGGILLIWLPITNWVFITPLIFGLYVICYFVVLLAQELLIGIKVVSFKTNMEVSDAIGEALFCLIFWLLLSKTKVMKLLPTFQQSEILGLHTWKWVGVPILVLLGYNCIRIATYLITWLIDVGCQQLDHGSTFADIIKLLLLRDKLPRSNKYFVYWANGVRRSINFILSSLLILLTWVIYFGSHLEKAQKAENVFKLGRQTCICLLICCFFWLIKTCIVLAWEGRAVYDRLTSTIIDRRKQLYFLAILGHHKHDIFGLRRDQSNSRAPPRFFKNNLLLVRKLRKKRENNDNDNDNINGGSKSEKLDEQIKDERRQMERKWERVEEELLMHKELIGQQDDENLNPTIDDIKQMAQYFLRAKDVLSMKTYVSDLLNDFNKSDDEQSIEDKLYKIIIAKKELNVGNQFSNVSRRKDRQNNDWEIFKDLLQENVNSESDANQPNGISYEKLQAWVERAHSGCLILANTLSSAKDGVKILNNVISGILIGATFIMWLLLTQLATTNVLVLITSPLLAGTFIFGDTCKNLFQGIIFIYVLHRFDVGDLCVIDGEMMKVKAVGIWETAFSKIESFDAQAKVTYANSVLANKKVINHKNEFDWDDYVEFDLSPLTKEEFNALKEKIENYLHEEAKDKLIPSSCTMEVLAKDNTTMKIVIRFKHKSSRQGRTQFECLQRKREVRADIYLDIQDLVKSNMKETSAS